MLAPPGGLGSGVRDGSQGRGEAYNHRLGRPRARGMCEGRRQGETISVVGVQHRRNHCSGSRGECEGDLSVAGARQGERA